MQQGKKYNSTRTNVAKLVSICGTFFHPGFHQKAIVSVYTKLYNFIRHFKQAKLKHR